MPAQAADTTKPNTDWYTQGDTALNAGDNETALNALNEAIKAEPQSARAYNARGVAYLRMSKPVPAQSDFTKAIQLKPDEAKFYANLAFVHSDQENYTQAIADLTKAISLEPQSPEWYQQRGVVFLLMEDESHARSDFDAENRLENPAPKPQPEQVVAQNDAQKPHDSVTQSQSAALPGKPKQLTDDELRERTRILTELEEDQMKTLREVDAQIKREEKNDEDLSKRVKAIAKAKRRTPQTEKSRQLTADLEATKANLKSLEDKRVGQADGFEQKRREILARYPLADEVPPIKFGDRWLTQDEYNVELDQRKAGERQEGLRKNGQRLANWVWQSLAQNYECKARHTNVVLIRQARVRFANPQQHPVYSLTSDKTNVELCPLQRDERLDDSYAFEVEYANQLGQVLRKNGYVEVGYDYAGTAYLLGVMVPFLDNPLDGQLAATRSSLDNALERAFGR